MKTSLDKIFIGTMSGTSHDGIDVCALHINKKKFELLKFNSYKYPDKLRKDISDVIQNQKLSLNKYFEIDKKKQLSVSVDKTDKIEIAKFFAALGIDMKEIYGSLTHPEFLKKFSNDDDEAENELKSANAELQEFFDTRIFDPKYYNIGNISINITLKSKD